MTTEANPIQLWDIPAKNRIRFLVDRYIHSLDMPDHKINTKAIVFNDAYLEGGKNTGILWMAHKNMEPLIGLHQYLSKHGVKVKGYKYWGKVHSIWFACEIESI